MFKTERIERLVECVLWSGFVKDDVPLSLMLISEPESAKTSILRNFECDGVISTMDISPKVITGTLIPKIQYNNVHHLIIPDLLKVLAHKQLTVQTTILFFNAMMEEGVKDGMFFGQEFHVDGDVTLHCGLITSVTKEYFYRMFKRWHDIGFTSRFIPVSYAYSPGTIREIHSQIQMGVNNYLVKNIKRPSEDRILVSIPDDITAYISVQSQELAEKESKFELRVRRGTTYQVMHVDKVAGFRLHRQFKQLLRSMALSKGKVVVDWADVEEFKIMLEYITLPNDPKVI